MQLSLLKMVQYVFCGRFKSGRFKTSQAICSPPGKKFDSVVEMFSKKIPSPAKSWMVRQQVFFVINIKELDSFTLLIECKISNQKLDFRYLNYETIITCERILNPWKMEYWTIELLQELLLSTYVTYVTYVDNNSSPEWPANNFDW